MVITVLTILPIISCPIIMHFFDQPESHAYINMNSNTSIQAIFVVTDNTNSFRTKEGKFGPVFNVTDNAGGDEQADFAVLSMCDTSYVDLRNFCGKGKDAIILIEGRDSQGVRPSSPIPSHFKENICKSTDFVLFLVRHDKNKKLIDGSYKSHYTACIDLVDISKEKPDNCFCTSKYCEKRKGT